MCPNPQETADLNTFTEEILNGKFYFLCSVDEGNIGLKWVKIKNSNLFYIAELKIGDFILQTYLFKIFQVFCIFLFSNLSSNFQIFTSS